jgi:DNA adenine methylase
MTEINERICLSGSGEPSPVPTDITPAYSKESDKAYLKEYLKTIRTKTGFKRLNSSPLRYAGGKSKAIGLILEYLPELSTKRIVSPFIGGGSVELVLAKELGFEVIAYDIFHLLVEFWNVLIDSPVELSKELEYLKPTEEDFTRNRHILLHYWESVKPPDLVYKTMKRIALTEEECSLLHDNILKRVAYYYYNMQLSYGPMFLGWGSSVYLKEERYKNIIDRIRDFKGVNSENFKVICDSFENVIPRHSEDFLFLDPPYYLGEDSKMFKGMYPNCNFAIHHNGFPHHILCELLKKHSGGFFLTYNDCKTIREYYKDYIQIFPSWQYTYGQGETRIGKNRKEKEVSSEITHVKESHEIFIICPPKKTPMES